MTETPQKPLEQPAPASREPPSRWTDADLRSAMELALRVARRWCRNPQDAEDIAQEAVQRLLLQDRVVRLHAWLAVVVRRLAWQLARHRQAEEAAIAEATREAARATRVDRAEALCAARELLARASPHDRLLLELDAIGYSDEEIGRQLGYRTESVHTLLTRSRERLRRLHAR